MKQAVRTFKETLDLRASLWGRIRSHRYFPLSMLAMVVLSVSCLYVWQRVRVLDLLVQVDELSEENLALLDETKKMYSDISELSMAYRIRQYALDSLGMKPVAAEHLKTLDRPTIVSTEPDDLTLLVNAVKRVAEYTPVLHEEILDASELQQIPIDSTFYPEGVR
jgi:cell division protein FtsL